MAMGNGNERKVATDRGTAMRLTEGSGEGNLGFVQVVCPYSVATAGLAYALMKAGIRYGPEPPLGSTPGCVVLCAQDAENIAEAIGRIRKASTGEATEDKAGEAYPVLIFAAQNDLKLAEAALRGGARGFVHAGMTPKQILRALSVAVKGELVAPRELLESLIAADEGVPARLDALSARQREILQLVAEGLTNAQIGKRLFLTESTIKQHLRGVYKTLGVENRTQAAKLMRRAG
jgi:DNA-binding NarL/FixJ family response regulator